MTTYKLNVDELQSLRGKTILIIGGVSGIGRAAVDIAYQQGASVAIGDWDEARGHELADSLQPRAWFRKCDVSNWDDVLHLFHETWKKFGIIHAVLSNAGVNTHEGLLNDRYDSKSGTLLPPDIKSIEVNLLGQIYVAKCAMHYFKKWPETKSHIVMTASAGSFFPAPPIHMYCAAKSGVLGLMRSLRHEVNEGNATINVVAPWITVTSMLLDDWLAKWGNLPKNSCEGVARALLLPVVQSNINGKAFFVAGDEITELEDSLAEAEPHWLGKKLCEDVNKGQRILLGRDQ